MATERIQQNRRWWFIIAGVALLFALSFALRQVNRIASKPVPAAKAHYQRIISLAPSITETLFALGLGDAVVGVTRYCDYPKEAKGKQDVGGYFDPNYEAILGLEPDLVVTMPEHEKTRAYLAERGIRTLTVSHKTIPGILASIQTLGEHGGVPERAAALIADLRRRMARVAEQIPSGTRPKVMIVMGRDVEAKTMGSIYIAGRGGWYDELLNAAGGENAFLDTMPSPRVSAEGILKINPEVIVEMLGDMNGAPPDRQKAMQVWRPLAGVKAVREGRVHLFLDDFAIIPGPRFVLTLERLARVLHPEVDWEAAPPPGGER
ncbi:MAG: ABC transporter substrate-binding protein [Victivallales bacterium]|jgi:iron complex transport system substrate-binding protein|nr:ABC transporter substrate-binding protein [Victivallales bacterium]MBT7304571.1 ABC transporter substrate-binding protein [Victivallales bacterium]